MEFNREITNRIAKFQGALQMKGIDGALLVGRVNVYYFSGTGQNAHLFIPATGEPILMVKKVLERAINESPLKNIVPLKSIKEIPQILRENGFKSVEQMAMELDIIPANTYFYYKKIFENSEIVDVSSIVRDIRMIKSEYEIELIRISGKKHKELYDYAETVIKEGMTDRELAGEIEGYARKIGHQGYVRFKGFNVEFYFGHTLVGKEGATPGPYDVMPVVGQGEHPIFPQGVSSHVIKAGEPIYIDLGGNYSGYLVDQTRIYAIGKLPGELEKAMDVALEIQEMAEEYLKEGVNAREIYDNSVKIAEKAGLKEHYMGYPEGVSFLGHGIGLEVNEWPVIARGFDIELKEGMVVALEPKFVFPQLGVVGIENTYLVTKGKAEKMTVSEDNIKYII